jgi:hypothetical protein
MADMAFTDAQPGGAALGFGWPAAPRSHPRCAWQGTRRVRRARSVYALLVGAVFAKGGLAAPT